MTSSESVYANLGEYSPSVATTSNTATRNNNNNNNMTTDKKKKTNEQNKNKTIKDKNKNKKSSTKIVNGNADIDSTPIHADSTPIHADTSSFARGDTYQPEVDITYENVYANVATFSVAAGCRPETDVRRPTSSADIVPPSDLEEYEELQITGVKSATFDDLSTRIPKSRTVRTSGIYQNRDGIQVPAHESNPDYEPIEAVVHRVADAAARRTTDQTSRSASRPISFDGLPNSASGVQYPTQHRADACSRSSTPIAAGAAATAADATVRRPRSTEDIIAAVEVASGTALASVTPTFGCRNGGGGDFATTPSSGYVDGSIYSNGDELTGSRVSLAMTSSCGDGASLRSGIGGDMPMTSSSTGDDTGSRMHVAVVNVVVKQPEMMGRWSSVVVL